MSSHFFSDVKRQQSDNLRQRCDQKRHIENREPSNGKETEAGTEPATPVSWITIVAVAILVVALIKDLVW